MYVSNKRRDVYNRYIINVACNCIYIYMYIYRRICVSLICINYYLKDVSDFNICLFHSIPMHLAKFQGYYYMAYMVNIPYFTLQCKRCATWLHIFVIIITCIPINKLNTLTLNKPVWHLTTKSSFLSILAIHKNISPPLHGSCIQEL